MLLSRTKECNHEAMGAYLMKQKDTPREHSSVKAIASDDSLRRGDQDARRIASPEMLPEADPLPHLICSRPMFIGEVKDEADQYGSAGRAGGSDSGAVFAGGQDGA